MRLTGGQSHHHMVFEEFTGAPADRVGMRDFGTKAIFITAAGMRPRSLPPPLMTKLAKRFHGGSAVLNFPQVK
jgi:hypothetical protein